MSRNTQKLARVTDVLCILQHQLVSRGQPAPTTASVHVAASFRKQNAHVDASVGLRAVAATTANIVYIGGSGTQSRLVQHKRGVAAFKSVMATWG